MTTRLLSLFLLPCALGLLCAGDWTYYRGPHRDGSSPDRNLPSTWSLAGENLAWKAPYGGRSTPVIHGDRMYVTNGVGSGASLQERLMCLNADTGQVLWEYRMKVYLSDVPTHRVSWASPAVDPETGNVYVFGVGGLLAALNRQGKLLWEHSMAEEQGLVTTHGGRTISPVVFGNLVIVGGISTGWGDMARPAHRYFAFDKRNGQFVWISTPGGRPFDTTYSPVVIREVNGVKLMVAGGGDGAVHAIKVLTGEPVWSFTMSKRGINTGVLVYNNQAIVSHSEENLDTSAMGLLASINAAGHGKLGPRDVKWKVPGFQGGYSTPVMDGDHVFQIDNGANLYAFDFHTGKESWKQNLGTIQKASPVIADGKIYVGTEGGKFFILKPRADRCEILSEVELGKVPGEEQVIASAAIARGRVYFVSTQNIYALGKKGAGIAPPPYQPEAEPRLTADVPAAHVQVVPAEVILRPGETVKFMARTFDAKGRFIQEAKAEWSLEGLKGKVEDGSFSATPAEPQAGSVKAAVGGISGVARVRVVPPLPWSENFDGLAPGAPPKHWVNATGKYQVREVEGNKLLVKLADSPPTKRARIFMGPGDFRDYTVEVDFLAAEKRRQMGDAGVVAQRYELAVFGNHQRVELQSWQPETRRTVVKDFTWTKDTWYHMKLEVENLPDGSVRARGKIWPKTGAEPGKWTIERIDPPGQGNQEGAPGLYADAPYEVFFDNFKAAPNGKRMAKVMEQ